MCEDDTTKCGSDDTKSSKDEKISEKAIQTCPLCTSQLSGKKDAHAQGRGNIVTSQPQWEEEFDLENRMEMTKKKILFDVSPISRGCDRGAGAAGVGETAGVPTRAPYRLQP